MVGVRALVVDMNPFNGIESVMIRFDLQCVKPENPFNGIESLMDTLYNAALIETANPFNGIERGTTTQPVRHHTTRIQNPFNGIESRGVYKLGGFNIPPMNPFNGIESLASPFTLLPYASTL